MSYDQYFRKEVLQTKAYHLDSPEGVKLNQNESPFDLPIDLKAKVMEEMIKTPWNRYPIQDHLLLQKKMAKYLQVWPDKLLFANGSNVLIQAIVMAASSPKKIMVFTPSFSLYELSGKLFGTRVIKVPLNEDYSIPLDTTLSLIEKENPAIIFIANPNAPTGNLFDEESLKTIIKKAPGLVVIDEAYYPFSNATALPWMEDHHNLIILRTFSKAFALAGIRLGTLIAEPEIISQIKKCVLPFCVNKFSYIVASCVLDKPKYLDKYCKEIIKERDKVYKSMTMFEELEVFPSETNFIFFKYQDSLKLYNDLLRQGIIIRDISDKKALKNCLRVTIGTHEENKLFLLGLRKALAHYKREEQLLEE